MSVFLSFLHRHSIRIAGYDKSGMCTTIGRNAIMAYTECNRVTTLNTVCTFPMVPPWTTSTTITHELPPAPSLPNKRR